MSRIFIGLSFAIGLISGSSALAPQAEARVPEDYWLLVCNNSPWNANNGCQKSIEKYIEGPDAAQNVSSDLKLLTKSCNPRKPMTAHCGVLAYAYDRGIGVETNAKKAEQFAEKGCPAKQSKKKKPSDMISCMYRFDKAKAKGDVDTAKKYANFSYQFMSEARKTDVLNWLAYDLNGSGGYMITSGTLRKDCDAGLGMACFADAKTWEKQFGWNDRRGDNLPDVPAMYYQRGCDAGHGESCMELARGVKAGKMPGMSAADAGGLIARACQNGFSEACGSAEGQRAAKQAENYSGISPSLPVAEQMLMADVAIERGYAAYAAQTLYRLSEQDYPEARVKLGTLYLNGATGFPADKEMAYRWFAHSEHPDGLYLAALMAAEKGDMGNYEALMNDAYWAGNKTAEQWWLAKQKREQARSEAIGRATARQAAANAAAEYQRDRMSIARAMGGYGETGSEKRVCAMIYQGGRMTRECMPESHFDKYFRP